MIISERSRRSIPDERGNISLEKKAIGNIAKRGSARRKWSQSPLRRGRKRK